MCVYFSLEHNDAESHKNTWKIAVAIAGSIEIVAVVGIVVFFYCHYYKDKCSCECPNSCICTTYVHMY